MTSAKKSALETDRERFAETKQTEGRRAAHHNEVQDTDHNRTPITLFTNLALWFRRNEIT